MQFQQSTIAWLIRRAAFEKAKAEQHAQVDRQLSEYLSGEVDALLAYCYEVLAGGTIRQNGPRKCHLTTLTRLKCWWSIMSFPASR